MKTRLLKISKIILFGSLFLLAGASSGAAQNRTGKYVRGTNGEVIIKDTGRGANRRLHVEITVGQPEPGCGYANGGYAKITGVNTAVFALFNCEVQAANAGIKPVDEDDDRFCRIKLVFSGRRKLTLEEGDHCSRCHGFSCEIDGAFFKKERRIYKKRAIMASRRTTKNR